MSSVAGFLVFDGRTWLVSNPMYMYIVYNIYMYDISKPTLPSQ